jgi:hypothetical protein
MSFNTNARIPVIPLSYEERHLAVPKELVVDYNTGNIYIVSSEDKTILMNITDLIKQLFANMPGDQFTIIIEGIGEVNLGDIIKQLKESAVYAESMDKPKYVGKQLQYDMQSIEVNKSKIQLVGFKDALPGYIPVKGNLGLEWREDKNSNYLSLSSLIDIIEPDETSTITLLDARVQKTVLDSEVYTLVLPTETEKEYSKIIWHIKTGNMIPVITFPNNVIKEYENSLLVAANSIFIYEFETWDKGQTWLVKYTRYGQYIPDEAVTVDYLSSNLYDKQDVQTMTTWKEE